MFDLVADRMIKNGMVRPHAVGGRPVEVVRLANEFESTFDYGLRSVDNPTVYEGALEWGGHSIKDLGNKAAWMLRRGLSPDWAAPDFAIYGNDIKGFAGVLSRGNAADFVFGFEYYARAGNWGPGLGIHAYAETAGGATSIWLYRTT